MFNESNHIVASRVEGVSCTHKWLSFDNTTESTKLLKKKFDEDELGDNQTICTKCGAYALWEDGKIFAYDAINITIEIDQEIMRESRSYVNKSNRPSVSR